MRALSRICAKVVVPLDLARSKNVCFHDNKRNETNLTKSLRITLGNCHSCYAVGKIPSLVLTKRNADLENENARFSVVEGGLAYVISFPEPAFLLASTASTKYCCAHIYSVLTKRDSRGI